MDLAVRKLIRQHNADPADDLVKDRLLAALLRQGYPSRKLKMFVVSVTSYRSSYKTSTYKILATSFQEAKEVFLQARKPENTKEYKFHDEAGCDIGPGVIAIVW